MDTTGGRSSYNAPRVALLNALSASTFAIRKERGACSREKQDMRTELIDYSETTPIQYETGNAEFMGMEINVDPRVLIPRPETELLVDVVSDLCHRIRSFDPIVLEIGTGSGIIPIGLKKKLNGSRILATDISFEALEVARLNLLKYGCEEVLLVQSNMFNEILPKYEGIFDVVVSNPPYVSDRDYACVDAWVKAEPSIALRGGPEGMDHLNTIIERGHDCLRRNGVMAVEIGYDQAEKVKNKFRLSGFHGIKGYHDLNGYERVIVGHKNG